MAVTRRLFTCMLLPLLPLVFDAPRTSADRAEGNAKVSRLQGSALQGRRDPVVGATVLVRPEGDTSDRVYLTTTDEKGRLRIEDLPNGDYLVVFTKEGYGTVTKRNVEVKFPFRPVVEVSMAPLAGDPAGRSAASPGAAGRFDLHGTVALRNGEQVPEVSVRMVRTDGSIDPRNYRTAADGSFHATGLPAGEYNVEMLGVGFLPLRTTVSVNAETAMFAYLIGQPADYDSSPLDLAPPEVPVAPQGLLDLPEETE